jgi:carboxyl-terminal processing protease
MSDLDPAHPIDQPDQPAVDMQAPDGGRNERPTSRASVYLALFLVAAIGGGGLFVSGFALGRLAGATPGTTADRQDLFRPFWDAYNDVSTNYVGTVDPHLLVEGAIKGLFDALGDPYSLYLTEEEYRASLSGISGEFEGVGIEMTTRDGQGNACDAISTTCQLVITRVIRGAPAVTAGLLADDVILAVDGKSTVGLTVNDVVPLIKGPKGSTVTLTIQRAGQTQDIAVTRDVIQREDVTSDVLADGRIGYLKIAGFSSASSTDFHDQLRQLVVDDGVKALILDVRDDPGGYVEAAQKIASEFVSTSPLYWEQSAGQPPVEQDPTPGGVATDPSVPVVVLVNGGTASASEIVAGSLQGNGRALLVGQQTFGKGTIQEFKELPGAGGYRLSVRKWLTPDQTWIHGVGLTPDIQVEPAAQGQQGDPQLDKAIQVLLDRLQASPAPSVSPVPSPSGANSGPSSFVERAA